MRTTREATSKQRRASALPDLSALRDFPDWLAALADPTRVEEALRREVPELSSKELRFKACEVRRVRLKKDTWTAHYRVTIGAPGGQEQRIDLVGEVAVSEASPPSPPSIEPFGRSGWQRYLPDLKLILRTSSTDASLPTLPALTDPNEARGLLEQAMRNHSRYRDFLLESCEPQVMRYKPGSRCTILYRLGLPPIPAAANWPVVIVAKTYRSDKGENAYEGMTRLWNSPLRSSDVVSIAEPLAFLPDRKVLLQGPIPGSLTLKTLIKRVFRDARQQGLAELEEYVRKSALGLAELHGCGIEGSGPVVTWEDEIDETKELISRLPPSVSAAVRTAEDVIEALESAAAESAAEAAVPSHRSFRPAQVLLHNGSIGFIDFDGFCQAEPALDVAMFCSTLKDIGMRAVQDQPTRPDRRDDAQAELERLSDSFLQSYGTKRAVSPSRVLLWETLYTLTAVLHCWTKVKFDRLDHRLGLLRDALARVAR